VLIKAPFFHRTSAHSGVDQREGSSPTKLAYGRV